MSVNPRQTVYRVFYSLPPRVRRRIVRLFAPTYIVGALTLVRDLDGQRMLLVRQPAARGWSLPGGLVNRHEEPIVAAARELREETGVDLPPSELEPLIPNAVVHHKGGWVDMMFTTRVSVDVPLRIDPAEIVEAGWFALDDLPHLTRATAALVSRYGIGSGR